MASIHNDIEMSNNDIEMSNNEIKEEIIDKEIYMRIIHNNFRFFMILCVLIGSVIVIVVTNIKK